MGLDPTYFNANSWSSRLSEWLSLHEDDREGEFINANAKVIRFSLENGELSLRMIANIPAVALQSFLKTKQYHNIYTLPDEIRVGRSKGPSKARIKIDTHLFGCEKEAANRFFGAISLGGAGIRFYGEYCLVLRDVAPTTQIFDRNSYCLLRAPISEEADPGQIAAYLRGEWKQDVIEMVSLKVLPQLAEEARLAPAGVVSAAVLHDESFMEVHRTGSFTPGDLYEVRLSAVGQSVESHLEAQAREHAVSAVEEHIWLNRRSDIRRAVSDEHLRLQIVETEGRSGR